MPRGNDSAGAVADLLAKGGISTNVDRLITANKAHVDFEVTAVSLRPKNEEASAALDLADYDEDVPDGHKVIAAAVRGNAVVLVVEDQNGRSYKKVVGYDDTYVAPDRSEDDKQTSLIGESNARFDSSLAQVLAEQDAKMARFREELSASTADEMKRMQAEHQEKLQAHREELFGGGDAADEVPDAPDAPDDSGSSEDAAGGDGGAAPDDSAGTPADDAPKTSRSRAPKK